MNYIGFLIISALFLVSCSKKPEVSQLQMTLPTLSKRYSHTYVVQSSFKGLPAWKSENYEKALHTFIQSCQSSKTEAIYGSLCEKARSVENARKFLEEEFTPFEIVTKDGVNSGLLTGYYEPQLRASLEKNEIYKYPIYKTPNDLISVDLSSIYPKLKHYRLRGRIVGQKLLPYYTREEASKKGLDADVLCYCDSKIDKFFLEVQGSGRVILDDGKTVFIGYANQNGQKYRSIGHYLVKKNIMQLDEVSLQSIRAWLEQHPQKMDEILNYNKSMVFFREKKQAATGSLGIMLTPQRSVAVDTRYIPLGSMLYMSAQDTNRDFSQVVLAQDTGGAIKGSLRADLFLGYGAEAMEIAGRLKSPLHLWIFLPKKQIMSSI